MKVKEFTEFLQSLDQEADLLWADYYYDCREGFKEGCMPLRTSIMRPEETILNKHVGKGISCYLVDFVSYL